MPHLTAAAVVGVSSVLILLLAGLRHDTNRVHWMILLGLGVTT